MYVRGFRGGHDSSLGETGMLHRAGGTKWEDRQGLPVAEGAQVQEVPTAGSGRNSAQGECGAQRWAPPRGWWDTAREKPTGWGRQSDFGTESGVAAQQHRGRHNVSKTALGDRAERREPMGHEWSASRSELKEGG